MNIIIFESQYPRFAVMNWLVKTYGDLNKEDSENKIVFKDTSGNIIFEFDKNTKTLKVKRDKVWKVMDRTLDMDKYEITRIIRAFGIDTLKISDLKNGKVVAVKTFDEKETEDKLTEEYLVYTLKKTIIETYNRLNFV